MTMFDEGRPIKQPAHEIGADLSMLSLAELDARITLLNAEIERLEAEKQKKKSGRTAADDLFRR